LAEAKQVVFAHDEVTLHTLLSPDPVKDVISGEEVYNVEAQVLLPGQSVAKERVPPYVLKHIEDGRAPGLSVMSESEADELAAKAAEIRAIAAGESVNVQGVPSESDANKASLKAAKEAVSSKKATKSEK